MEGPVRRVDHEDSGRFRRIEGQELARVVLIAEAQLAEAAADITPALVDLVGAGRARVDARDGPGLALIVRAAFELDAAADRDAVVEGLLESEVGLDVLVQRLVLAPEPPSPGSSSSFTKP